MLLKGENIPSSEGFPGQEDSSVEERQVSVESHAPIPPVMLYFPLSPTSGVQYTSPEIHCFETIM